MKKIRRNVFETNSSSVHTFVKGLKKKNLEMPSTYYEDGKVHVSFGEYDRGTGDDTDTPRGKLEYLLTALGYCHDVRDADGVECNMWNLHWDFDDDDSPEFKRRMHVLAETLMRTPEFNEIEAACKEIWPDWPGLVIGEKKTGYIDHQSVPESWEDVKNQLASDTGMTLAEWIASDGYLDCSSD